MEVEKNKSKEKNSTLVKGLTFFEGNIRDLTFFLPLPICFVSPGGIILEINPTFKKFVGYKTEEIIGKPIENIFNKKEIEELIKETLEKGFVEKKEVFLFTKEREEVPTNCFSISKKGKREEIAGYLIGLFDLRDIKKKEQIFKNFQTAILNILEDTEENRKKAEEEKNKTQAIIYYFNDGLLFFDNEKFLRIFNPQAEIFFEIKSKEVVNKKISFLKKFLKLKLLLDYLEKRSEKILKEELKIEDLVLTISSLPIFIAGEVKIGTLIILHDITREKQIEKMKSEFVSIASHQLRTPLSAVKWTLHMLLDGDLGKITLEQREFLEKTYKSNERMITLVNDLLDVSRIEERKYLYKPILTEIENIVETVISSSMQEAKRKKVKLKFQKSKKRMPYVKIDVEKIKLTIQNLLNNAINYTLPGGMVIVSLKQLKKEIEFRIQDTGVGISKDQQHRVFAKFFRGANVMRMETDGSGLGLFIAKNIIKAHGGKIWFKSEENKGSTFWFTLPTFTS